jgi:hypothetical protein
MKTNHAKYEEIFEEVVAQRKLVKISELNANVPVAEKSVPAAEELAK